MTRVNGSWKYGLAVAVSLGSKMATGKTAVTMTGSP